MEKCNLGWVHTGWAWWNCNINRSNLTDFSSCT